MFFRSLRRIGLVLLALGLQGCASGPEKPNARAPLPAEGAASNTPDAERNDDGAIPFHTPDMTRPTQIGGPTPSLPPEAIAKRVRGIWIAHCVITETGLVEGCKVVKGLADADGHILEILHAQKYTPIIYKGVPQRVRYTFKIKFR